MINKHWDEVYQLWSEWQFHEAADRGYDFRAAKAAEKAFDKAKQFYEIWYGKKWELNVPPSNRSA